MLQNLVLQPRRAVQEYIDRQPVMDGARLKAITVMDTPIFVAISDNPHQRDTVSHAKKADYLEQLRADHLEVQIAELPDGSRYKINGHTRAYRWSNAEAFPNQEVPQSVMVMVYECDDLDAVKRAYQRYDSRAAVHSSRDDCYGALRAAGLLENAQSPLLKAAKLRNGMTLMLEPFMGFSGATTTRGRHKNRIETSVLVDYWHDELKALDSMHATKQRFPAAILAAALVILAGDKGPKAIEFLTRWEHNEGFQEDGFRDAIAEMNQRFLSIRAQGGVHGMMNQQALFSLFLSAYESFKTGFLYSGKGGVRRLGRASLERWGRRALKAKGKQLGHITSTL